MNPSKDKSRDAIAEEAAAWFVSNDEQPLDARDATELAGWFKSSPVHIEEFLGVAEIASDLKLASADPDYSLEAILARAQAEPDAAVEPLWPHAIRPERGRPARRWFLAAAAMAACLLLGVGALLMPRWNHSPGGEAPTSEASTALHFKAGHGQQLTQRLADNSVLHLNTDSAVSVHYSRSERLVVLESGQATFEVAHEARRTFHVQAGLAEIVDLGTRFDVRLDAGSTVVTVVHGRVAVAPMRSGQALGLPAVELNADQQLRVSADVWPAMPVAVDAERVTAWLHHQIAFENEPLERVAAEYNRYTLKPIEISTPALRTLRVSGVFATDDTDAFVAFLRSLEGVKVEVTATKIRVMRQ